MPLRKNAGRGRNNAFLWLSLSSNIFTLSKTKIENIRESKGIAGFCLHLCFFCSICSWTLAWSHKNVPFPKAFSPTDDLSLLKESSLLSYFFLGSLYNRDDLPRASCTLSNFNCWNVALTFLPLDKFCFSSASYWDLLQQLSGSSCVRDGI